MNVVEAGGRRERRLQVGAMDTDVRRSETLTVRRPHLVPANEAAGAPVPVISAATSDPCAASCDPRPNCSKKRVALADSATAAPTSRSSAVCS